MHRAIHTVQDCYAWVTPVVSTQARQRCTTSPYVRGNTESVCAHCQYPGTVSPSYWAGAWKVLYGVMEKLIPRMFSCTFVMYFIFGVMGEGSGLDRDDVVMYLPHVHIDCFPCGCTCDVVP